MKKGVLVVAMFAATLASARAQGGLAIGGKIGTLGPGVELTGYLLPELNIRVGGTYLPFTVNGSSHDVDYDVDVRFASLLGTLDWHPFENNFRISAGAAVNNNKLKLKGKINENTTIGDHEYTPDQIGTLSGEATFDHVVPYIGVGFGNAVADDVSLTFSFDLGVMIQGKPEISLRSNGAASAIPQFQQDLKEEERDAQDVADHFKVYPVLAFGISYYFW